MSPNPYVQVWLYIDMKTSLTEYARRRTKIEAQLSSVTDPNIGQHSDPYQTGL